MITFDKLLYSDPSLAPFLPPIEKEEKVEDKKEKVGKNTLPIGTTFPKESPEYYLELWDKMKSYVSDDENAVKDAKQLDAMIGRLYKMFNHLPITATGRVGNSSAVICQLALLTLTNANFNAVLLGGNINEYAYYSKGRNSINTLFTNTQSVHYKGGENGRRKDIGQMYRVLVDKVYQFTNTYLTDFKEGGTNA